MPRDPNHWSSDELRQRFEAFSARFAEKGRPGPAGASAAPPADDYWKSLQDLFTRDVTARDFQDLVRRDGEDTWRFFTREIDFSGLERKPWYRRYPAGMWKVFLALAFRLSPARRVIFATSVLLLVGAWVKFILTHAASRDSLGDWPTDLSERSGRCRHAFELSGGVGFHVDTGGGGLCF